MESTTMDEQLLARLTQALLPRDEVLDAYLFGSHARGQAGSDSDVDVAVYVDETAAEEGHWGYRAELTTDLMAALGTDSRPTSICSPGCCPSVSTTSKSSHPTSSAGWPSRRMPDPTTDRTRNTIR